VSRYTDMVEEAKDEIGKARGTGFFPAPQVLHALALILVELRCLREQLGEGIPVYPPRD
jgi:hypothetical protein